MAVNGSFELEDVLMNTYVSSSQRTIKQRFDLTQSQVDTLKARGGAVKLYVNEIVNPGNLQIRLNEQSAGSAAARSGYNTISFSGNLAEVGTNWIEISGTGKFDVGEVSVELA
jgi:hypothetical protein